MKNLIEAIKQAGFTKLGYGVATIVAAIFGVWSVFYAMLGIFLYINANTIYKYFMNIKL